uniref:HTH_48 domain-containing protein n=1 Tax=Nippostrongylus brasiliensis TaxID=27835 RepID=A0A0N4XZP7_NIPBR
LQLSHDYFQGDSEDITCCVTVQSHLFITASADGGVRQYNSSTKKREWRKNYGEGITCASVDSQGTIMALGFCSGSWSAVNLSTRETVFEQKESTQPITTVQFAPNGSLLFVATKDLSALIYRHDGSHRFQRSARIGALSSFVISTDWDISSQFIRGNSSVGHIYHWSATNGELVDQASVRDVNWATCNCRLSYEAGCVAHSVEGITFISRSLSKDILAVGRDNGSLRLYSCPTLSTTKKTFSRRIISPQAKPSILSGLHLNMNRCDFRVLMIYEYKLGHPAADVARHLGRAFGIDCPCERTMQLWFRKFASGDFDLEVKAGRGRKWFLDEEVLEQPLMQIQRPILVS